MLPPNPTEPPTAGTGTLGPVQGLLRQVSEQACGRHIIPIQIHVANQGVVLVVTLTHTGLLHPPSLDQVYVALNPLLLIC